MAAAALRLLLSLAGLAVYPAADALEVTAWTEDGTIMAVKHKAYPWIQGVQFHPESIITENGLLIVKNWVKMINDRAAESELARA